jgi:mRNA interferase MazF
MTQQIKRGDIYYADLNPVLGSEQGDTRPCLVVQNNIGNKHSPTVVIVPLTSSKKAFLPTHVRIRRTGGLVVDSTALCEQVRTIDRRRLDGYIGQIDSDTQATIDAALATSVGLKKVRPLDMTLCRRCASEFEDGGYLLVKRGWQMYKEPCDICRSGMGWEFGVFDRKKMRRD